MTQIVNRMINKPEIAIVDANTLSALGLQTILKELIPMATIRTFNSFEALIDDTPDMYAHYFVSAHLYVEHASFFLERKKKTIIMAGESQSFQLSGVPTLNIYQPKELLVKAILNLHLHAHHKGFPPEAIPPKRTLEHEHSARQT